MIGALLDANVLVSGFPAASGVPAQVIDRWRAGQFRLTVSEHILDEVERAWRKPYWQARFSPAQVDRALTLLRTEADIVSITVMIVGVASHPEDDLVLAAAVSARVDCLVTGDQMLRQIGMHEGIHILSPHAFVALLEQETSG